MRGERRDAARPAIHMHMSSMRTRIAQNVGSPTVPPRCYIIEDGRPQSPRPNLPNLPVATGRATKEIVA